MGQWTTSTHQRTLPYHTFLDRLQKMFNIYQSEAEELSDAAKVRILFQKVQHPQLVQAVGALKVRFDMDGINFTEAANHFVRPSV